MIVTRDKLKELTGVDYYDGSIIHNRFAYKFFRDNVVPTGNIIAFSSPTKVETDFMIDLEDVLKKDYIYSDEMINFCYELPCTDLFGGVSFQRLFCALIGDILSDIIKHPVELEGDDIFVCNEFTNGGIVQQRGKSSVSIVCERNNAILGHTGININAGSQAPAFAYSTKMNSEQAEEFMTRVIQAYYETSKDIWIATTKLTI